MINAATVPYISIIIPAYNEANRLPATLRAIQEYLQKKKCTYEVLVIDDGSTDNTAQVINEFGKRFSGMRFIHNSHNKGKGAVVRQGMALAQGEYRLFTDADNSTPIAELDKLLPFMSHYDVVIGSRYLELNSIKVKQPIKRRIISRGGNLVIQILLLPGIKDTQCGFKLFTAQAAQLIFIRQQVSGWAFDVELLTIARLHNLRIKEVAVNWLDANNSSLRATRDSSRFLKALFEIRSIKKQGGYK